MKKKMVSMYRKLGVPIVLSGTLMAIIAVLPGVLEGNVAESAGSAGKMYSGVPRVIVYHEGEKIASERLELIVEDTGEILLAEIR